MGFILALILYCIGVRLIIEFILPAAWMLICYVALLCWEIIKASGRGLIWTLPYVRKLMRLIWNRIYWSVYVFVALLIELFNPSAEEDEPCEQEATQSRYERALELLHLEHGFSAGELKRAYLNAIKDAHPDAGGSEDLAQAINAARDFLAASLEAPVTSS